MKVRNVSEVKPEIAHNATWVLRTLFSKNDPLKSDILWINEVIVEPGNAVEPHSHSAAEEIWYIIEGNGVVRIDNEERNVGPGDAIYTPPKHTHSVTNNTPKVLRYIEVATKVKKTEFIYNILEKMARIMFYNKLLIKLFLSDSFPGAWGENFAYWKILQKFSDFSEKDVVLDIGGGCGIWSTAMAPIVKEVIVLDLQEKGYKSALRMARKSRNILRKEYNNIQFVKADAHSLPLREQSADKVMLNYVLEHLENPSKALSETVRTLKEHGIIVASTPNAAYLLRYSFPFTKLLQKLIPKNILSYTSGLVIGDLAKLGLTGWEKKVGHLRHGFQLTEFKILGSAKGLEMVDYSYFYKDFGSFFWELKYCLPVLYALLRPLGCLVCLLENDLNHEGLDVIVKYVKQ